MKRLWFVTLLMTACSTVPTSDAETKSPGTSEIDALRADIEALRADVDALQASTDRSERPVRYDRRDRHEHPRHGEPTSSETCLERDQVNAALDDPASVATLGRALLHRGRDGDYDGFQISGIRSDTLTADVGLKNGDVVHSVGGHSLTSIDSAMAAYTRLKEPESLDVVLTRDGHRHDLTVRFDCPTP